MNVTAFRNVSVAGPGAAAAPGGDGLHHPRRGRGGRPNGRRPDGAGGARAGLAPDLLASLLITAPVAPTVAALVTVADYADRFDPFSLRDAALDHPLLAGPAVLLVAWLALAVACLVLGLAGAERVQPSSFDELSRRAGELKTWCDVQAAEQAARCGGLAAQVRAHVEAIERGLADKGPRWVLGTGYIALWRQLHAAEALLAYIEPKHRLVARADDARARIAHSKMGGAPEMDAALRQARRAIKHGGAPGNRDSRDPSRGGAAGGGPEPGPASEPEARAAVSRIQRAIDDFRTDRYAGLLKARNHLVGTSGLTAATLYVLLWLVIVARVDSRTVIAATACYLIGAMVGLFNLLYTQAGTDSAVDDYGLAIARLFVTPQLSGIAAVLGVVITTTVAATQAETIELARSFDFIQRPVNVLTAAAFALSPGLVLDRLRQRTETYKEELRSSRGAKRAAP